MFENENQVIEEVTENVEETTEETAEQVEQVADEPSEEKIYTQKDFEEKVRKAVDKRVARREAKIHRDYQRKYGDLETVLKAGTQKEDVAEIAGDFREFYEGKGIRIPTTPEYSTKDIETLATAEANEIISGGLEDVTEELDRLTGLGVKSMSAREKQVFKQLAEYHKTASQKLELSKLGVSEDVYGSKEFKDFASKFSQNTPITEIYNIYNKMQPKKEVKPIDYIKVNDNICVNVLGTGIDVEVLINFEKHTKLKGSFRYFVSLIEALFQLKFHEFDVSIDGGPFERKKGLIIALCNGSDFGGGITICPIADSSDGKLEFVFVDEVKKIQIPKYLINLMSGKILKMPATQHIQCEKAVFKDANNLTLQIDGNITNEYKEYKCEIVRKGINMYR